MRGAPNRLSIRCAAVARTQIGRTMKEAAEHVDSLSQYLPRTGGQICMDTVCLQAMERRLVEQSTSGVEGKLQRSHLTCE